MLPETLKIDGLDLLEFQPVNWREVLDWERKIFTYSGQLASPDNPPSLFDIAVSTARIPRFTGNCQREWVVLSHQINVANICYKMGNYEAIPYALLHDGAESVIGDIPTPFKTKDIRDIEDKLLRNIYLRQGLTRISENEPTVKFADAIALVMEAEKLLLPEVADYFTNGYASKINLSLAIRKLVEPNLVRLIDLLNYKPEVFKPQGKAVACYVSCLENMQDGLDLEAKFEAMLDDLLS